MARDIIRWLQNGVPSQERLQKSSEQDIKTAHAARVMIWDGSGQKNSQALAHCLSASKTTRVYAWNMRDTSVNVDMPSANDTSPLNQMN